jgi:hypothetical protein
MSAVTLARNVGYLMTAECAIVSVAYFLSKDIRRGIYFAAAAIINTSVVWP